LHDFSTKPELRGLAAVVRALQDVAVPRELPFFIMGAAARDLMLHHAHGLAPLTGTEDIDFGVMVRDWPDFDALRAGLLERGAFSAGAGDAAHRLRHASGIPLDLVPFGGVENANRELAWPPEKNVLFNCFGMQEALQACTDVHLPDGVLAKVANIPALTVLKIAAWRDRRSTHPRRDAPDLLRFMHRYMDCDNFDRVASAHGDLFGQDFDYVEAGVRLLARDVAQLLVPPGIETLLVALRPEADAAGGLHLAYQSGQDLEHARRLVEVFCAELDRLS